jgi:hypothetical protein
MEISGSDGVLFIAADGHDFLAKFLWLWWAVKKL